MRLSKLFGKTLREVPAEAETAGHRLMLKSGMIQQISAGVYSFLPLGWRALLKIEQIIREEMDAAGGQELMMPALQPLELWQSSGRDLAFGKSLFTFKDRKDRPLVLAPTHEEVVTDLVRRNVRSYRDLPLLLYQMQTKFRDEPRPRGGLMRVREFIMKDAYSFHADEQSIDECYKRLVKAYTNIFTRCGLPSIMIEADSGAIGGKDSHEFMLVAESGEDEIISCDKCGYAANVEKAGFTRSSLKQEALLPLEEVSTPGKKTIEEVAGFLSIPRDKTLKAVFYMADARFVLVTIRGDLEVNEVKLKNALKCSDLRLATEEEVKEAGVVAGSASAVGLKGVKVVADDSIASGQNFVVGANKLDYHLKNANHPRDFKADIITDIARAEAGHRCPRCDGTLQTARGIELGHVFKLGTVFSEKFGAYYLNDEGAQKVIIMGCYGIGVGRLLGAIVEHHHDDKGIIWSAPVAPYQVHICALGMDDPEISSAAEKLYSDLEQAGYDVLFDDRVESAGVKFNDADLLGMPVRITVSRRTLKTASAEVKRRSEEKAELAPLSDISAKVKTLL